MFTVMLLRGLFYLLLVSVIRHANKARLNIPLLAFMLKCLQFLIFHAAVANLKSIHKMIISGPAHIDVFLKTTEYYINILQKVFLYMLKPFYNPYKSYYFIISCVYLLISELIQSKQRYLFTIRSHCVIRSGWTLAQFGPSLSLCVLQVGCSCSQDRGGEDAFSIFYPGRSAEVPRQMAEDRPTGM